MSEPIPGFTAEQVDALGELVNIGFGRAAALLSKLVNSFVRMSVPRIERLELDKLPEKLAALTGKEGPFHVVRQSFRPKFRGECLLVLDEDALAVLHELLELPANARTERDDQDGLLEVANIIHGALIGKFSEIIGTVTTFSAPILMLYRERVEKLLVGMSKENDVCILIHTGFAVEKVPQFQGYVVILLSRTCLDWLTQALDRFAAGGT